MADIKQIAEGLHIGIIMDGNGRWAKKRGLPRTAGHARGVTVFQDITRYCNQLGLSAVTYYAFSTENWSRPPEEVQKIMSLLKEYLHKAFDYKKENNRVRFLGDPTPLDPEIRQMMTEIEEGSRDKTGMILNLAINYGGRAEIVQGAQKLARQCLEGDLRPEEITESLFSEQLYTAGEPDPDIILRPSGEKRLSNFLLWQCAYSEFIYMNVLWPDFKRRDLDAALEEYASRSRRFGGV